MTFTKRLKRILAVVAAAAVVAVPTIALTVARADSSPPAVIFPHWPVYRWAGVVDPGHARAFWIWDRTGDPAVWAALNNFRNDYDNRPGVTFGGQGTPWVEVAQDYSNIGLCTKDGLPDFNLWPLGGAYSVGSVCFASLPAGTLGQTYTKTNGSHNTDWAPASFVDPNQVSGIRLQADIDHELGHMLGLGHSTCTCDLMYPSIPQNPTVVYFSQGDIQGLQGFYYNHPHDV